MSGQDEAAPKHRLPDPGEVRKLKRKNRFAFSQQRAPFRAWCGAKKSAIVIGETHAERRRRKAREDYERRMRLFG